MADGTRKSMHSERDLTSAAAVASGEIHQMPDGQAGVMAGINAAASGDVVGYTTEGVFTVAKTASVVIVDGQPVYWDHSANSVTYAPSVSDRDFFCGSAVGDAASADTTMLVNLNVMPAYIASLADGPYDSVRVGSSVQRTFGSTVVLEFDTTAEAQKVDALSKQGFAVTSNWIIEGAFEVVDNGDHAALDFNIGVSNGTHSSDCDSITESVFLHVDGTDLNIFAESDDGTTEVASTDTTVDYVEGTEVTFVMDGRNQADVQLYVNGVLVLGGSTFNVTTATGPLKLLAHLEKSSNDTPGEVHVNYLRVRTGEV